MTRGVIRLPSNNQGRRRPAARAQPAAFSRGAGHSAHSVPVDRLTFVAAMINAGVEGNASIDERKPVVDIYFQRV